MTYEYKKLCGEWTKANHIYTIYIQIHTHTYIIKYTLHITYTSQTYAYNSSKITLYKTVLNKFSEIA